MALSCLVLDVALPDLNGLDLQKLVADRIDMPIIFITGYGDVPTTIRAMKAGAVEFLTTPYSDDVLLTAIQDAIGRSRTALRQEAALRDGARTSTHTSSVAKRRTASIPCRPAPPRQTEALSSRTSRSRPLETSQPSGARAKNERSESVQGS